MKYEQPYTKFPFCSTGLGLVRALIFSYYVFCARYDNNVRFRFMVECAKAAARLAAT